jgi:hypothetical protein
MDSCSANHHFDVYPDHTTSSHGRLFMHNDPRTHPVKACTKNIGSFPRCYFCFIGFGAEPERVGPVAGPVWVRSPCRFVASCLHNPRTKKMIPRSWSRRSGPPGTCSLIPIRFRTASRKRRTVRNMPEVFKLSQHFQSGC